MARAWWAFQECGWPSWLSLLLGTVAFAFALAAFSAALLRARASVPLSWLALGLALSPLGTGAAGMDFGRAKVDQVLTEPSIDASQRERIRAEGYREAGSCVTVGGVLCVPSLLLAGVALATAYALRRKPVAQDAGST